MEVGDGLAPELHAVQQQNAMIFVSTEPYYCSSLYGPGRVTCCPTDPGGGGEAAMLRAMDTLGEVGLVVSGHAGPLRLDRAELAAPRHQLEQRLESRAAARDRAGLERAARLAVKEHKQ